jgi:arsenate reductase
LDQRNLPVWSGKPVTAHWGLPDPAAATGSEREQRQAFRDVLRVLENRLKLFVSLPVEGLDNLALECQPGEIGRS